MRQGLIAALVTGIAGAGVVFPGAAAKLDGIELTGLVSVGSIRAACVHLREATCILHPGESISGITLEELDADLGWAVFSQGTNRIRVRLSTGALASATPNPTGLSPGGTPAADTAGTRKTNIARFSVPPGAYSTPWVEANLLPSATVSSSEAEGLGAAPVSPGARSAGLAADSTDSSELEKEGELIRGLYGAEAFHEWDLAHPNRRKAQ
jgi:hypothetical protein